MQSHRRFFLLLVSIFLSLIGFLAACNSTSSGTVTQASATQEVPQPTEALTVPLPPAVPETRMLTLEFPPAIRAGDADIVRLTLEVDQAGNLTPTAETEGNVIHGQTIVIPNVYATHNVLAEARLDMAGLDIRPSDLASEPLLPGQSVTFFWSVHATEIGHFKGTVWFYLRFVPKDGGPETRETLSAQAIEIDSTTLFGFRAEQARWLGVLGTFISSLLGLPFLEQILRWLWKKLHRR